MNRRIEFEVPEEVLISLKESDHEFTRRVRVAAAAKLFQMDKLSSGRAAQLAGMPRLQFLQSLRDYGVAVFDVSKEELLHDVENA